MSVNIYEAALAAKAGKVVTSDQCGDAVWVDGVFVLKYAPFQPVRIHNGTLNGWSIVEEPPKEYTFAEALPLMKQGKRLRSMASELCHPFGRYEPLKDTDMFSTREIEGKWIEVNP